jgi:restriction system protein
MGRVADKVILIDGETLANLMIDHGVSVSLQRSYEVKRVDSDYFSKA